MIVGKHIQLRAIEYDDLPTLIAWRNDPKVYRYFYEHEPLSLAMQKAWFEKLTKSDEKFWIVETLEEQQAIGTIGLVHIDWRSRKAELARVLVIEEYRHRGYGSELLCLLLRYCFDHLNMNRLYCDTFAKNQDAVAFYEKFGFKREGILRQHVFKDGCYCDLVYYGMLREEYLSPETQAMIAKYLG
jgi:UDP-4-amino-4,6-dideoxy-N-acetyl-beta-L-altrosamine N-acetyltransferase